VFVCLLLLAQRAERPPAPACCVLRAVCGVGAWRCGGIGIVHRVSVCVCAGSVDKQRGGFVWKLTKPTVPRSLRARSVFMLIWDVSAVINCQMEDEDGDGGWMMMMQDTHA